jgi:hypothetical protein
LPFGDFEPAADPEAQDLKNRQPFLVRTKVTALSLRFFLVSLASRGVAAV